MRKISESDGWRNLVARKILVDAHAHLDEVDDVARVLEAAGNVGVGSVVAVGMDTASNLRTLQLADTYPEMVYPAVGYHPWRITRDQIESTLHFVQAHLSRSVALGEIGLDYKVKVKKALQRDVLAALLKMAAGFDKPVVVHSRFSHQRCYQMVQQAGVQRAVFHWYSGPADILQRIIASGYLISATPALAYSPPHQAAVRSAPLERILVETDTPVAYQGLTATPAMLLKTIDHLSRLKQCSKTTVAQITAQNAVKFYGIASERQSK